MSPEDLDKTRMAFDHLRKCAQEGRTVTYGEIGGKIGEAGRSVSDPYLNHIRDEICIPRGLPWISALGVNKRTGFPGQRWFPVGYPICDGRERDFWNGIVLQVYAVDWSKISFEKPE